MRCLMEGALDVEPTPEDSPAVAFGDYELLSEMGRGGQGTVYRALQKGLNRTVALKCIPASHFTSSERLKRFRLEAEAAARLEHPGIVPVFEVGERHGFCFYSMKLMEGGRLDQALRGEPMKPHAAAELTVTISRTVHYAHQRGILHRDLKPANILLDAEGRPHLSDFGLARLIEQESTLTHTLGILGTPSYMAPEQAGTDPERAGEGREITTAADVYGLGAILYHLLTGGPPFAAGTTFETVRLVLEANPRRPSLLNRAVDRDLETICMKCLEKDPRRRYGSAEALAEELERWARHEPIVARPVSANERLWRWCRRKPALAALSAMVGVLLVLLGVGAPFAALRIDRERQTAKAEAYASDMHHVQQVWAEGNLRRAQALLRAYMPKPGEPDQRGFEWRYLWSQCHDESEFSFTNFPAGVRMTLSPDGAFLAAISGSVLKLIDYQNHREIKELTLPLPNVGFRSIAFCPNDTNCVATTSGRTLLVWDLVRGQVVQSFILSAEDSALSFSTDGHTIATSSIQTSDVEVWDLKNRKLRERYHGQRGELGLVRFSPDGRFLVSNGGSIGNPLLWDLTSGNRTEFAPKHTTKFWAIDFVPDGRRFITGGNDCRIIMWDFASATGQEKIIHPGSGLSSLKLSPDGQLLATGADDATVRLWKITTGEQKSVYRGHRASVTAVAFSPDGQKIISSSVDGTVKIWPRDRPTPSVVLLTNRSWTGSVSFSPDGQKLAAVDLWAGVLSILDVKTGLPMTNLTESALQYTSGNAKFTPDGRQIVLAEHDGRIRFWDASSFELIGVATNGFAANSAAISSDSSILALAGLDNAQIPEESERLAFWDLAKRTQMNLLKAAVSDAACVAFGQKHPWIAVGYMHGHVRIWNYRTEKLVAQFHVQNTRIWSLAFDPEDASLVAGAQDGTLVFYDPMHSRSSRSPAETSWWVLGLAFSPDGNTLASAESDGSIQLWNTSSRRSALELRGHAGIVSKVAFSPDGNLLASCGADGTVRLWRAPGLAEIEATPRR